MPSSISWASRATRTCGSRWVGPSPMTSLGFGLALIKPNVDYEMTLMLLAHGLSVATGAAAFHNALVNFRALTGAHLIGD